MPLAPEYDSIFGPTYNGVPNPQIPFKHKYPTRYHGSTWNWPEFKRTYVENPNGVPPFLGVGSPEPGGGAGLWIAATAVMVGGGAALGYFMNPEPAKRGKWAAVGGLSGIFGPLGLIIFAVVANKKSKGG
jgi:hypothetical protein